MEEGREKGREGGMFVLMLHYFLMGWICPYSVGCVKPRGVKVQASFSSLSVVRDHLISKAEFVLDPGVQMGKA